MSSVQSFFAGTHVAFYKRTTDVEQFDKWPHKSLKYTFNSSQINIGQQRALARGRYT